MRGKFIDLTGQTFGKLYIIERADSKGYHSVWLCRCGYCGKTKEILGSSITRGTTISCGCQIAEVNRKRLKKYNTYDLSGDYGIGYTLKGEEFYFDLEDYDKIKNYCWLIETSRKSGRVEAFNKRGKSPIFLHQVVMGEKKGLEIDHIDRNQRNARKYNLRFCTHQENMRNKGLQENNNSGVIGVTLCSDKVKWHSQIEVNGKGIHLGFHENFEDAVISRLKAEKEYFGEFAPQQELFEKYGI